MEPLDPAKNIEGSGFSRRRISSILKAPRRSTICRDPEQQENEVESVRAVEKRNSRRVSFAPANDVLLFAKDAKNASPARSPLQELIAAAATTTQNRVQVAVTEDNSQQIMGIENLLNAPLHASQQRDVVNFDTGKDFGEKTVMFSTEDAVMDMTHSHTINIARDAELLADMSMQNYDILEGEDRKVTVDDQSTEVSLSHIVNMKSGSVPLPTGKSTDLSVEQRNSSSKLPCLDHGFENFLASLSKPNISSTSAVTTRMMPFGEKTVKFSTEDAVMDMTHSHTINIASDAELLGDITMQNYDIFDSEDRKVTVDDQSTDVSLSHIASAKSELVPLPTCRSKDLCVEKRNSSSKLPCLDPGFENFLASLSKSSVSSTSTVTTRMMTFAEPSSEETRSSMCQNKTQRADMDKENKVPKSCNASRKVGESFQSITFCPEGDVDMSITEALTGHNLVVGDEDPFQCLFPTQAMYSHADKRTSQVTEMKQQQNSNTLGSADPKEKKTLIKHLLHAPHQRHVVNSDPKDECREKTVIFSADDECLDMTQSDTVNIFNSSLAPVERSANSLDPRFNNFLTSLSRPCDPSRNPDIHKGKPVTSPTSKTTKDADGSLFQHKTSRPHAGKENLSSNTCGRSRESFSGGPICSEDDPNMDQTETLTGCITGLTELDDPFQFLILSQEVCPLSKSQKKADVTSTQQNSGFRYSNNKGMETSIRSQLQRQQEKLDSEDDHREKTVRFSADDDCMDVTQSHTVNIATDLKLQLYHNEDLTPSCGEKTVRFTVDDAAMDITQCLTVNIGSNLVSDSVSSVRKQDGETCGPTQNGLSSTHCSDPGFSDPLKKITKQSDYSVHPAQSSNGLAICPEEILGTDDPLQCVLPTESTHPQSGNQKKTEVTSHQQSNEATETSNCKVMETSLQTSIKTKIQRHQVAFDADNECREKTVRFTFDDANMDVTRSHTSNIVSHLPRQSYQTVDCAVVPAKGEETMRFTTDEASMDVTKSHTVNIATDLNILAQQKVNLLPANREKTMTFTADDACMDVTKSHTVNIATDLNMLAHQKLDLLPANREKTMRFTADDACMDVTKCHTVNIATHLDALSQENLNFATANREREAKKEAMDVTQSHTVNVTSDLKVLSCQNATLSSTNREKTIRYDARDETMDVTRSHTVNIATEFESKSSQNMEELCSNTEKPVRFAASNTLVDMTQSQTVNMPTNVEPKSHQTVDFVPECGDRTVRFTTNDAGMDMTRSLTINIASNSESGPVSPLQSISFVHENLNFPVDEKSPYKDTCVPASAYGAEQEFENSATETRGPWTEAADTLFCQETDSNKQRPDMNTENESPSLVLSVMEKPVNKTLMDCPEISLSMDMAEAQTGCILEQTCTDGPSQSRSSMQSPNSDHLLKTELTSQKNEALGSSSSDDAEVINPPDSIDSNETETMKEHEPTQKAYLAQRMESSASTVVHDGDASHSRKSRRMSLADLQSKVRRLSHMIAIDSCTAPLPQLNQDLNKNSNDKPTSLPEVEPKLDVVNTSDNPQAVGLKQAEPSATSTASPFSLKTKKLISRLSVGRFKPKLPQRTNPEESKKVASAGEPTRTVTVNVTNQLNNFDNDISDIYDEELGSYEDMSETLETRSPDKNFENESSSPDFDMFEPFEENVFECTKAVHRQKRSLPKDEDSKEDEKRLKTSTEFITPVHQSDAVEFDSNIATTHITTQTTDSSNSSHTASRCEAAFESTIKNSLFESQLADYTSDDQKKLEDGTITVVEFFKLFNIDFVIHNPRQSIVPARLLPDADTKSLDLLKDRHISLPKQMVYEMDIQTLIEKVEGLKVRMQDLDKPLKTVNRNLWEEMRYSSEKEIKSFGAKLKEKNNFFRKTSKVKSHEMKEVLYSNLVQANQKEQQKLRETIEEADGMIKSLDNCIFELESELAAVEEKGTEENPSLKSLQEETKKVTEALADNDRKISELEMEKMQNSSKLNSLKAETKNLESHINMLNMLNEWKLRENGDNCTVYTFLYETMVLQLVYEKSNDSGSDQKITDIAFKMELDDEKSHFHSRLVHKLLSQYIEGESAWVEKYPTRSHVPKLLHDVSLVVGRCRLLGEELRLLKMWGGLRLDIIDISCMDTRLNIVFSSLKKFSKFEVLFAISLIDRLYVLHVESFKNMIGSTTIQQIEEIVASFTPGKNLLTKIVRKIHNTLLS